MILTNFGFLNMTDESKAVSRRKTRQPILSLAHET